MDLTVKDWLIIIGGLLAAAVLLDGYRRMRNDRRETIRVASRKSRDDVDEDMINPELPGGTARVIAVRESPSLHVKRANAATQSGQSTGSSGPVPAVDRPQVNTTGEDFDDDDILFRDPSEEYVSPVRQRKSAGDQVKHDADVGIDDTTSAELDKTRSLQDDAASPLEDSSSFEVPKSEATRAKPNHFEQTVSESARSEIDDSETAAAKINVSQADDMGAGLTAKREDRAFEVEPSASIAASRRADEKKRTTTESDAETKAEHQELMVLNVLSPTGKPFNGSDMLQILLACDVRYGKMNIFHRYEKSDGTGPVQFSIANLVEPGDFDLDGIEDFTTPGLVFFMHLPGPKNSIKAFDAMLETARCLVNNLGGELRDQTHSVATKQTLEHYRQRIRDFERRQLTLM